MTALLLTALVTGFTDSFNPIAISQQFVLQGMVKKPWHIWFFIIMIAITNFTAGMLAYFGLITPLSSFVSYAVSKHRAIIFGIELILGIACMVAVGYTLSAAKTNILKTQLQQLQNPAGISGNDEATIAAKVKSVSPLALCALGIIATLTELTSALPYFAFLTVLFSYDLTVLPVVLIMIMYNIIYSLPLIAMYFIYIKSKSRFDSVYRFFKKLLKRISAVTVPLIIGIIGSALILHAIVNLAG